MINKIDDEFGGNMSKLIYKTKDGKRPDNKSKVYFCSLKEDFNECFEHISDRILNKFDCSIWYTNNYESSRYDDAFYKGLKLMNLMVLPVTSKFIFTNSNIYEKEIKFAIENNIPILSIFQEEGISESFYNKYDLKDNKYSLNNYVNNDIVFDIELERYLNSVLVSTDTNNKIKNEFDGMVFFAYRKKDIDHVRDLAKYINTFDFTKDISICYDDNLVETEDFNSYTRELIDECKLFVLVVTPNTLLNDRETLKYQCSYARNKGKQVLPIELVETDKDKLYDKFNDIQKCINIDEKEKIVNVIRQIINKSNDQNLDHNYYIGLSYLYGIGVEVDKEKGIDLIIKDANNDSLKAIEKLAHIYKYGIGLEPNYENACYYFEKLLKEYKKKLKDYNANNQDSNLLNINLETVKLELIDTYKLLIKDNLDKFVKLANAKEYCEKAIDLIKNISNKGNSIICDYLLCDIYQYLVYIYDQEINIDLKIKYIYKIFKLYKKTYRNLDTIRSKRDYAYYLNVIGNIIKDKKLKRAKKYANKSIKILKELNIENRTDISKIDLSQGYYSLGCINILEKKYDDAKEVFARAIEILKELLEEKEILLAKVKLANSYEMLSKVFELEKEESIEKQNLSEAISIIEPFISGSSDIETYELRRYLAHLYEKKANLFIRQNNDTEAVQYYQKALNIYEENLNDAETIVIKEDIRRVYAQLSKVYFDKADYTNSNEYNINALNISKEMYEETKTTYAKSKYAYANYVLALTYYKLNLLDKVEIYNLKALELYDDMYFDVNKDFTKEELLLELANVYDLFVQLYYRRSKNLKLKRCSKLVIRLRKRLYRINKSHNVYCDIALMYKYLWDRFHKKTHLKKAKRMFKKLFNQYPENNDYRNWYNGL